MKILVTGFDPFGGESINPALEAVTLLPNTINGATIHTLELPTVFHKSADVLKKAIKDIKPNAVLCVGQAGGRFAITPERVAINLDDARIPDNEHNQPIDESIQLDGENAYFTSLPVKAMVSEMKKEGIPASISNSAGTFVCNHIMYHVLYMIDREFPDLIGGFMHVPYIPEQVVYKTNKPSMSLLTISKGLEASIRAIVEHKGKDIKEIGGTIH